MKHFLFLGLVFFSSNLQVLDNTLDEIEFNKMLIKRGAVEALQLPDMNVKFDIFVSQTSIFYEMPKLFLDDQEVKCNICGACPVMIEYKREHKDERISDYKDGKLLAFCLQHAPRRRAISTINSLEELSVPPIPSCP